MLGSLRQIWNQRLAELNGFIEQFSILILAAVLAFTTFQKLSLIFHKNGGGDLLGADIPKSMMLVAGQNPYGSNPWASPYPPLLLVIVGSIIKVTSGNIVLGPDTIGLISQNIRIAGIVADAAVAIIVFLALKAAKLSGLSAVGPVVLFLTLPSISLSPYYWFNSDVLGYPILAAAVLALIKNHQFLGPALLATATVFKIHPILAIPLVIVWLIRTRGLSKSLPTAAAVGSILAFGLAAPMLIPGYLDSIIGFNMSSGFGNGTSSFTIMNLLYGTFPILFRWSLPMSVENQVWLGITSALFIGAVGVVWSNAREFNQAEVVAIGLLVWLIPLRQLYTHYLVWAIVPFLMRGRLRQVILVGFLLELANTMASWSWGLPPDPFPFLASFYGLLVTSLVYLSVSTAALFFILRDLRRRQSKEQEPNTPHLMECYRIPIVSSA